MCTVFASEHRIPAEALKKALEKTRSRGPDGERIEEAGQGNMAFQRLSIMGLTESGMQPFHLGGDMAVCNGELYGFRPLKKELEAKGYTFASESDCELILRHVAKRQRSVVHVMPMSPLRTDLMPEALRRIILPKSSQYWVLI